MNRFEKSFRLDREAKLRYGDGEYHIIVPGDYVTCAVTGRKIPLDELRYWSVAQQEAYADAEAALKRQLQLKEEAEARGAD